MFLTTSLNTGKAGFRILIHDKEMQFDLKINSQRISQFNEEIFRKDGSEECNWIENQIMLDGNDKHTRVISIKSNDKTGWLIGDPILEKEGETLIEKYLEESDYSNLLQTINGHYRLIVVDRSKFSIYITCSLFGALPVYYRINGGIIYISTDSKSLAEETGEKTINRRFILENVLFYYQLFNETAYKNIRLLPSHQGMEISDRGLTFSKHTDVSDWFIMNPRPWKKSTEELADLFIDRVKWYLPDEPYIHSLTGGFDSRSLVSCGLYHKKNFETYGFGNEVSNDTRIAAKLSAIGGLRFNLIGLDKDYVINHSLEDGLQFINNSNGNAGFARAHYLFACKMLSLKSRYLVTGNFGSEIFRAAHNPGAVISNNLYHLFSCRFIDEAFHKIEASQEFQWINKEGMKREWEELRSDISDLPVFCNEYSGMTQNQRFYVFVFEEVFRKYFGAEMVNQFKYLNNRTPFLDSKFLRAILKTGLAGVHSNFFENNPVKRFKGQVLYAHFIRKTNPVFNDILTDKGYRPIDLLSLPGKLLITNNFLKKRLKTPDQDFDPNNVSGAFACNRVFFQEQFVDPGIFNVGRFKNSFESKLDTHDFLIAISQSYFLNSLSGKSKSKMEACF